MEWRPKYLFFLFFPVNSLGEVIKDCVKHPSFRDGDVELNLEEETAEEIIEQVLQAAKNAKDRLSARAPGSKVSDVIYENKLFSYTSKTWSKYVLKQDVE